MIVDERMSEFIYSLDTELPEDLEELRSHALETGVPILRKDSESLLHFLIDLMKPKKILEIGAAIGYSGSLMARWMPESCTLTTIEKVEMRLVEARVNLKKIPEKDRVTLLEGDALEILETLREKGETYDLIFMDAAKAQYMNFLKSVLPMMKKGSVLVTDNALQEGSLIESKFAIERRDRTIHMRMREYLYEIKHNDLLTTSVLTVGDGMALSVRK